MRWFLLLGALLLGSFAMAGGHVLDEPLKAGEADIWHLGHAGWLVRTSEHFLIFDYTGPIEEGSLEDGTLSAELLSGRKVVVFISHSHGDHFNSNVLRLRDSVEDLAIVMGWNGSGVGSAVVPADGEWTGVSGAKIFALHHDFDGVPEGFFLVRSGGLTLYHSGDHGTWSDPPNETFRANIDRLKSAVERIDIAFISAFGVRGGTGALNQGDIFSIRTLQPRFTLPMHCEGREHQCVAFATKASELRLPTKAIAAKARGAFFRYRKGELRQLR